MSSQFAVRLVVPPGQAEEKLALLAGETTGIVEESDGTWLAYFADRHTAAQWGEPFAVTEQDWSANWQSDWQPLEIGQRWYLAPPWSEAATPPGRLRLAMTPGPTFGSGDHPTTQMCLELLEHAIPPAQRIIDVGTGTGILSVAARELGAKTVTACDTDPEAAKLARDAGISVWQGSTASARSRTADLVLANLPGGLLIDFLPELRRLAPVLLVSGYLDTQAEIVEQDAIIHEKRASGEWRAALLSYPEDIPA